MTAPKPTEAKLYDLISRDLEMVDDAAFDRDFLRAVLIPLAEEFGPGAVYDAFNQPPKYQPPLLVKFAEHGFGACIDYFVRKHDALVDIQGVVSIGQIGTNNHIDFLGPTPLYAAVGKPSTFKVLRGLGANMKIPCATGKMNHELGIVCNVFETPAERFATELSRIDKELKKMRAHRAELLSGLRNSL